MPIRKDQVQLGIAVATPHTIRATDTIALLKKAVQHHIQGDCIWLCRDSSQYTQLVSKACTALPEQGYPVKDHTHGLQRDLPLPMQCNGPHRCLYKGVMMNSELKHSCQRVVCQFF